MNDDQVLEELSKTDAYAPGTLMPASAWSRDTALSQIERRTGMELRRSDANEIARATTHRSEHRATPSVPREDRSPIHQTRQESVGDPRRRGHFLIGAATALLVLLVGFGALAIFGGDNDTAGEPEIVVVLSAAEALNGGNIDTYIASLTGAELRLEEDVHVAEALSYANARTSLSDCRVTGEAPSGDSVVECASTTVDDFYGAGGIVQSGTRRFLVTEEGKISSSDLIEEDGIPWGETDRGMYNHAFWMWLRDAHPAVFDHIGPSPGGFAEPDSIPGLNWPASRNFGREDLHEADEMLVAVQYVGEFVAQSDAYPINQ